LFYDPQSIVVSVVEGLLTQYVMQEVSKAMFGGPLGEKVVTDSLADLRKSADADTPASKELATLLESVEKLNARARADAAGGKPAAGGIQGIERAVHGSL
jgi:hypothetical protein